MTPLQQVTQLRADGVDLHRRSLELREQADKLRIRSRDERGDREQFHGELYRRSVRLYAESSQLHVESDQKQAKAASIKLD